MLKATHHGELEVGKKRLRCAVLEDGTRILTQSAVFLAFGRTPRGKCGRGGLEVIRPSFVDANNLKPFCDEAFYEAIKPICYVSKNGRPSVGYNAQIIPIVCDVYLRARAAGQLVWSQFPLAVTSEMLVRSLAKVGIVALVDEATGYQSRRPNNALRTLLKAFISDELLKWERRFPEEYYRQLYRLRGKVYDPSINRRYKWVGKVTKRIIYKRLPKGIINELERRNPILEDKGRRATCHHQLLTQEVGHPVLDNLIVGVVALMKASPDLKAFEANLERAYPQWGELPS
jgi:hypothetical protein